MGLFEIKSWIDGRVLFSLECASLKICVEAAVKAKVNLRAANLRAANLSDANLRDANLRDANLRDADLRDADLRAANLSDADLRAANLSDANLRDANLRDADLRDADLRAANLSDANLRDANLRDANLSDADLRAANLSDANLRAANLSDETILPTEETWKRYISDVVPALLLAGGKALASFAESFNCHSWTNCPMAHGFSVQNENEIPALHRPRARQFIQLFDAGHIKWEMIFPNQEAA